MLISTSDGITSKIIRCQGYHRGTTFSLATALTSPTDIDFEIPNADHDPLDMSNYSGGWVPLKYDDVAVVLNGSTNHITIYGSLVLRVSKTAAEAVGVSWDW